MPDSNPVPVYPQYYEVDADETATLTSFTDPAHGVVALGNAGTNAPLTYTPDDTFVNRDEFTFTVSPINMARRVPPP